LSSAVFAPVLCFFFFFFNNNLQFIFFYPTKMIIYKGKYHQKNVFLPDKVPGIPNRIDNYNECIPYDCNPDFSQCVPYKRNIVLNSLLSKHCSLHLLLRVFVWLLHKVYLHVFLKNTLYTNPSNNQDSRSYSYSYFLEKKPPLGQEVHQWKLSAVFNSVRSKVSR